MRPTRIDALPTSRKAPTPRVSSSRATPPLTTERGETMIQESQWRAPSATRPRLRKRPPSRVTPVPTDHSPVRKVPLRGVREPTSLLRTGKLIMTMRLQDGGHQRGGVCHPERSEGSAARSASSRSSHRSRKHCALAPTPLAARSGSARIARATPNKLLHAPACRSLVATLLGLTTALSAAAFSSCRTGDRRSKAGTCRHRAPPDDRHVSAYRPSEPRRYRSQGRDLRAGVAPRRWCL